MSRDLDEAEAHLALFSAATAPGNPQTDAISKVISAVRALENRLGEPRPPVPSVEEVMEAVDMYGSICTEGAPGTTTSFARVRSLVEDLRAEIGFQKGRAEKAEHEAEYQRGRVAQRDDARHGGKGKG